MADSIPGELLQAALTASEAQKQTAIKVLRGESLEPVFSSEKEKYLTLKEAGKTLGFHPATLWRWRVPGHSLGGRRRFLLSEVRAYLNSEDLQRVASTLRSTRKGNT